MTPTNPHAPSSIPGISDLNSDLSLSRNSTHSLGDASPVPFGASAANSIPTRSLHAAAVTNSRLQQENQSTITRSASPTPSSISESSHIANFGSPALGATPRSTTPNPTNIKSTQPTSTPTAINTPSPTSVSVSPSPTTRRKSILLNIQTYEPNMPTPGEVANSPATSRRPSFGAGLLGSGGNGSAGSPVQRGFPPGHNRQASLGEIHQELEVEQEAQVNRLLNMIREQQIELNNRQAAAGHNPDDESAVATSPTLAAIAPARSSTSRPSSFNHGPLPPAAHPNLHPRSSFDISQRRRSRTPSVDVEMTGYNYGHGLSRAAGASPRVRTASMSGDSDVGGISKDESAYYQAEAQIITRENQMLRHRIRELEKQVAEMNANPAASAHDPSRHSTLAQSHMADEEM